MIKITNKKLGIALPHTWLHIPVQFFDSFIQMERPDFEYIRDYGGIGQLDVVRNNLIQKAIFAGCSHLLMMDTDQIMPRDLIPKLMSHNLPVVGALIYRRYPPFDPLMFKGKINEFKNIKEWERDSLVEVDATGAGCLLLDMKIFYNIPGPWFKFIENPNKEKGGVIGEDIYFCTKLKEHGYKIFVDTSVVCGHLSNITVDEGTWNMYKFIEKRKEKRENFYKEVSR